MRPHHRGPVSKLNQNITGYFDGSSYANIEEAIRACIDSLPNDNNTTYIRTVLNGSLYKAIIQKYINSNFASAVVFSYASKTISCYRKIGNAWENAENLITNTDVSIQGVKLGAGQDSNGLFISVTGTGLSFFIRLNTTQKEITTDTLMNGAWLGQRVLAKWT